MNIHNLHLKAHLKHALHDIKAGDFHAFAHKTVVHAHRAFDLGVAYCHHHPLRCGVAIGGAVLAVVLLIAAIVIVARRKKGSAAGVAAAAQAAQQAAPAQAPQAAAPAAPGAAPTVDEAVELYIEKNKPE
jgi:hypothetical protein